MIPTTAHLLNLLANSLVLLLAPLILVELVLLVDVRGLEGEVGLHYHEYFEEALHLLLIDLAVPIKINDIKYLIDLFGAQLQLWLRHLLEVVSELGSVYRPVAIEVVHYPYFLNLGEHLDFFRDIRLLAQLMLFKLPEFAVF